MNASKPPRRYLAGFVIAEMETERWGRDKVTKKLYIQAQEKIGGIFDNDAFDLVVYIEVEIFDEQEYIADHKFPIEVYRLPFIYDPNIRKAIVRLILTRTKYFGI